MTNQWHPVRQVWTPDFSTLAELCASYELASWRRAVAASLLTLLTITRAGSGSAGAAEKVVVGHVETMRGSSQGYRLDRDGESLPVGILTQVLAGDRIIVIGDEGLVRLRLTTGDLISIERRDAPYVVEARGAEAGLISNTVATVSDLLTPWHDWMRFEQNLGVREGEESKAGPLKMPLVPHDGAAVVSGGRDLSLAWFGGTAPFDLRLVRIANDQTVLEVTGLMDRELTPHQVELIPGSYRLQISDNVGQDLERRIEAVSAARRPQSPNDPALQGLPDELRATVLAGWLAQQDGGRWMVEALIEAQPFAEDFEPARVLRGLLVAGGPDALP